MEFKKILGGLVLTVLSSAGSVSLSASEEVCYPAHLYITRHVEKLQEEGNRDPWLSKAGIKRSHALARHLEGVKISALISSQFNRTRETLKPLAEVNDLDVEVHDVRDDAGLIKKILTGYCEKNLIIAGHSNTVPFLIRELGVTAEAKLGGVPLPANTIISLHESNYGTLFTLTWQNGEPKLSATQYGENL